MQLKKLISEKSKAQAMVEFAIALPVLLMLLYGIIETGRLVFLYSTIVNASRQAVRYGSATGLGNGTEPRYQDCDGIRKVAKDLAYISSFADSNITIQYDDGPADNTPTTYCSAGATADTSFAPTNNSRITVTVAKQFTPIVPKLLPFIQRTITASSSRTIFVKVSIISTKEVKTTITTITSDSPDPSDVGQSVPVTVTVTGTTTTPTGTVTITGADTSCTITLSSGTGTCNVVFTVGGARTLFATYNGDTDNDTSTDSEAHNVRYPTVLAITSHNPDPSTPGQAVNVVVTTASGLPIPDGQTIAIGGANTNCTITLVGGTGNCNVAFTSTGIKTLTATYAGSTTHSGSSTTAIHDVLVGKNTVTRITGHSPDPSELNQSVTVSVRVAGLITPTGTVNITGANTNCTITLTNGAGSCAVVFTSTGAKTISASYTGDANNNASSGSAGHTVNLPATTTTITAHTPDPSIAGQSVSVTVTVTGGSTAPTGTVAITGANTNCTITLPATSCNVVFSSLGLKTLSAVYSGDSLHASSNTTATHTVNIPSATSVPSCSAITHGPIIVGGNTMTMTITNPYVFPLTTGAGTVTWNDDKGHQLGSDKTLRLQSISIGATNVWTGNSTSVSTIPFTTPATIPANTTITITLTFHQSYDNLDGTEKIYINLTTPGCESNPIQ